MRKIKMLLVPVLVWSMLFISGVGKIRGEQRINVRENEIKNITASHYGQSKLVETETISGIVEVFPPVVYNQLAESEPNDDCLSADTITCIDTLICADLDDPDLEDYFVLILDGGYSFWQLIIQTHDPGSDCDPQIGIGDTKLYLYDEGCTVQLNYNDNKDGNNYYSKLTNYGLAPGVYVVKVTGNEPSTGGSYHMSISCAESSPPATGDYCDLPLLIDIPTDLPYSDLAQTTCGRGNYYLETCLWDYDSGEDIIYSLNIAAAVDLDITFDPGSTDHTGLSISSSCPPDYDCIVNSANSMALPHNIPNLHFEPGIYYLMIDLEPDPDCIASFDLTIEEHTDLPGDDCDLPITVDLPGDLPYSDLNQSSCGRGDHYDETCPFGINFGQDITYELNVTSTVAIDIIMDPRLTDFNSILVSDSCPPGVECIAFAVNEIEPEIYSINNVHLDPGTYYVIAEGVGPGGSCIEDFDLEIVEHVASNGDDCFNPISIDLPLDLPYADIGQSTCGRGNNSQDNCVFVQAEDITYLLNVITDTRFDVQLDPKGSSYTSFSIIDACPPGTDCLIYSSFDYAYPDSAHGIENYYLPAGTYYLIVDKEYTPESPCLPDFDLTINEHSHIPGDDCGDPILINVPEDLQYLDLAQTTCDRGYDNSIACGIHCWGEEIYYLLSVNSGREIEITVDPMGTINTLFIVTEICPPGDECIERVVGSDGLPYGASVILAEGNYYLTIEFESEESCIANFDLEINDLGEFTQNEYLPGDANMTAGLWPPRAWGNDITYLRNYFKGFNEGCLIDGFYAGGDINGDCNVTGVDIVHFINYFKALTMPAFCPDYEPAWLTIDDLPAEAPDGWPNCDGMVSSDSKDLLANDSRDPDVSIWIGNLDGSPINASIGATIDIDIYIQTTATTEIADLHLPLAADKQYIENFISESDGELFDSLTAWDDVEFVAPFDEFPVSGLISQSLVGWANVYSEAKPWLNRVTPTKIASFKAQVKDDWQFASDTVDCFSIGAHYSGWPMWMGDTLGINGFTISETISRVYFNPGGYIAGVCTNASSDSIENVYVSIDLPSRQDMTDAQGMYFLSNLGEGNYDISFSHPYYCDATVSDIAVTENDTTILNVELIDGGRVSATVTDSLSNPIENVLVVLTNTNTQPGLVYTDSSDASGVFFVDGIEPGLYDIGFSHLLFTDTTLTDVPVIAVDTTYVNMILYAGGILSGEVVNSVLSPIENVIIEVVGPGIADTTDANGLYGLEALSPGSYIITFSHPEYCDTSVSDVAIQSGQNTVLDITLTGTGTITGTVSDSVGFIEGVRVRVDGAWISDTTGIDGTYSLAGICPGDYDIIFSHQDYRDSTINQTINEDESLIINMELGPAGTITFEYLPGDVEMVQGSWPPSVNVVDIVRLVTSFKDSMGYCMMNNPNAPEPPGPYFWASADVNSDCRVWGNDVSYLAAYLSGNHPDLGHCSFYPSEWLDPENIPEDEPAGWPNCDQPPLPLNGNGFGDDFDIQGLNTIQTGYKDGYEVNTVVDETNDPFSPDILTTNGNVYIWFGNPDGTPISAPLGEWFEVDIYIQTSSPVYVADLHIPLAADDLYIDSILCDSVYGYFDIYSPLDQWWGIFGSTLQGSPPNEPGWTSISFLGWSLNLAEPFWLHSEIPTKILTFYVKTHFDGQLSGQTVDCFDIGKHSSGWPMWAGDPLGLDGFPITHFISQVKIGGGEITGVVSNNLSQPIADAVISIPGLAAKDTTDLAGEYSIIVSPGIYDVEFSHADYLDTIAAGVDVNEGEPTWLNMMMNNLGVIKGIVSDPYLSPIESVLVECDGAEYYDYTDIAGTYLIEKVDPGTRAMSFEHPHYQDIEINEVEVTSGDTTTQDATLYALGAIKGKVTKSDDVTLLDDALLKLIFEDIEIDQFITEANGEYIFPYLDPGQYDIEAFKDSFAVRLTEDIQVDIEDTTTADIILLRDFGNIAGEVTSDGVTPIEDVHVVAISTSIDDYTDVLGQYELNNLRVGAYSLKFSKSGYVDNYYTNIDVLPEQTITFDIELEAQPLDLSVALYSEGLFRPGFDGKYQCKYYHDGMNPASNSELVLELPEEVDYIASDPSGTYDDQENTITWQLGEISVDYEDSVEVDFNIQIEVPGGIFLTAIASISTTSPEDDHTNNTASVSDEVVNSWDPNEKLASPAGAGSGGFIKPDDKLVYTIFFENDPDSAMVSPIIVKVSDTLDLDLDWDSFNFGPISHPDICSTHFNNSSGILSWYFYDTSNWLPPNENPPEGEGFVTYSIDPYPVLPGGTEITNTASIRFDFNPWIICPPDGPLLRTIDDYPPTSSVAALPTTWMEDSILVNWQAEDAGGSGIMRVDIYVSENNDPYALWLSATPGLTESMYYGVFDNCYSFYSIAIDSVGYEEDTPLNPDASVCLVSGYEYLPGDANMPNGIWPPSTIGADVTYLVNYFRGLNDPCLLDSLYCSADVNGDCLVIGSDVTRLVNYFRGMSDISWCLDYEPAWPTPEDLPIEAPVGWPNCEIVTNGTIIPSGELDK
ncbi:MAG: hypothetical protein GY839_11760 [candidate division Zixibacteria bacterium]|nr:hypothetical protein [candidate division Zixibacteria bacterium]